MKDEALLALYWQRDEAAIAETRQRYGGYLHGIAFGILANREDSEECVSDTCLAAWQQIPPRRPAVLSAFLGRITRGLAIDRWRRQRADKRGGGQVPLALEELGECIPGGETPASEAERAELRALLNRFVLALPTLQRKVFLCRYWYLESVEQIARRFSMTESRVTSMLHRTREKLKQQLEKEGY